MTVEAGAQRMMRALRLEPVDRTPIWFMRQAGRSLPEYRAIKEGRTLFDICRDPDLCAEVTVQPVRRLGVDAAILYADIVLPFMAMGIGLEIREGIGPVMERPVRSASDLTALRPLEREDIRFVLESIARILHILDGVLPLLGFAGAPFTLASYLVEGRPSRDFLYTKRLMYGAPEVWAALMERLSGIVATYLVAQIEAGVAAVQLFDSWAGALSPDDYRRYVLPYSRHVFDAVGDRVPTIHFGTGTAGLLGAMREAGGSTIGVDWRVPLDRAWETVGYDRGIQGNLDPLVLQGPWDVVERETDAILERAAGRPGHVFNLGHGVHPQTDPDVLAHLVDYVHHRTAR